jgi:hypothetical protein
VKILKKKEQLFLNITRWTVDGKKEEDKLYKLLAQKCMRNDREVCGLIVQLHFYLILYYENLNKL